MAALLLTGVLWAEPSSSGLDLKNLDPSCPPSRDFFQYANGGWLKANPIPSDKPRWGTFNQLAENNQVQLQAILQEDSGRLGAFYQSGLSPLAQQAGWELLRRELDGLRSSSDLQGFITRQHRRGLCPFFSFSSGQDFKNSSRITGQLNQGGLGLPDCEYYTRQDAKSVGVRQSYLKLLADLFQRSGCSSEQARLKAQQTFEVEERLAKVSMTKVEQRDPAACYQMVKVSELKGWNWTRYFQEMAAPPMGEVNLSSPKFFAALPDLMAQIPLEQQKSYLEGFLLRESADSLDEDWAEAAFRFYGQALTGAQQMPPRWRRVVKSIDSLMGDSLGPLYVARHFPPQAKAKVESMVQGLRQSLASTLDKLDWMSPETKVQALAKLAAFRAKIGYPERWRDQSSIEIVPNCYLANIWQAKAWQVASDLKKIGQPRDPDEWFMTPPTVNAYYDPQNNEIVFPAGILQPPFFSLEADDAVNYGALGVVIGHEISHGFDDQGAQFDASGNLRNWWNAQDLKRFQALAKAIEDQFSGYQVAEGLPINGKLVVGESIADLGGLKLAWDAYQQLGPSSRLVDGFKPEQRFFLAYARIWAMNMRPEYERLQVNTDPHPHPRYRVNGPLSNLPEFQKAFNIPEGSPMVRKVRNRLW